MAKNALYEDFTAPPFSVLDARNGWWSNRKKKWIALGINSELGRADVQASMGSAYRMKQALEGKQTTEVPAWAVTSIFDPVLTELAYRWFSPKGGKILDPYAGGSVRGIVASKLERHYVGYDIRKEQIKANEDQASALCTSHAPEWRCADAVRLKQVSMKSYDFIFTCPPYGNLEVYSNDPHDISAMPYDMFIGALKHSIKIAAKRLKDNRFAAIVVGEFRDKNGINQSFVPDVIRACESAGLQFYNEAIFLQPLGTLPVRVRGGFTKSRKLGKAHQNLLVFVKGDPKEAAKYINECNANDVEIFNED